MSKIAAVVLGAGKGTRMNEGQASPIPKVMFKLAGQPMIRYSIDHLKAAGIDDIVVVVGYQQELIRGYLGDEVKYAVQEQQLGTGHAVSMAKELLQDKSDAVLFTTGDMPLIEPSSIKNLIETFETEKPTIALLTVDFAEPKKWAYGRIIRNDFGEVEKIVEQKDCSPEELEIKESNISCFLFDAAWLWENINSIQTNNAQHEYYITDMVEIARAQGKRVIAIKVGHENEAIGINTPEQLSEAEKIIEKL